MVLEKIRRARRLHTFTEMFMNTEDAIEPSLR